MTGTGTNTHILGRGRVAVLDPGPALPAHHAAIMAALSPDEVITHVLVSHTHLDHSALAPLLARRTGAVTAGFGPYGTGLVPIPGLADGGEGIDRHFAPDLHVADGDILSGDGWQVRALHTPGHAANHLCFDADDALFTGDHVMGWSTSLISPPDGDMAAYMASLRRLQTGPWTVAHPGHGPSITDLPARLTALITHRLAREAAICAALTAGPLPLSTVTARVYTDTAPALLPAATRNVLAHVIDLKSQNRLACDRLTDRDPIVTLA